LRRGNAVDHRRNNDLDLHIYPHEDAAFRADVQASIARSRATIENGRRLLESVRYDLAARYPGIRIEEQNGLAALDGRRRWYVYRDGKIA